MARLVDRFLPAKSQERSVTWWPGVSEFLPFGGQQYVLTPQTTYGGQAEPTGFGAGELGAITCNGTVYGIVRTRVDLFAQVKFAWRRFGAGAKPMASDLFTGPELAPLDFPADMLEWFELDAAAAGASCAVIDGGVVRRLPPRWCTIVLGSPRSPDDPGNAWDSRPIGLICLAPGRPADEAEVFTWDEVIHYCPERDPEARWRGISYLRPVMEDVAADNGARRYLTRFFENNATPNMAVVFPPEVQKETIEAFRDMFLAKHAGVAQAFRTAFLGGGADLKVVGVNLKDLDTENVRNQIHIDIANASGVPSMSMGLLEVNYANGKEANRALADRKLRYLWMKAVQALRPVIGPVPAGATLWYDPTGISALQADSIDDATVQAQQAQTMRTLIDGGFDPQSVTKAVTTGDMTKLVHSGNLSVQLIPAGQLPADTSGGNDE
jgi:hypothetical protein